MDHFCHFTHADHHYHFDGVNSGQTFGGQEFDHVEFFAVFRWNDIRSDVRYFFDSSSALSIFFRHQGVHIRHIRPIGNVLPCQRATDSIWTDSNHLDHQGPFLSVQVLRHSNQEALPTLWSTGVKAVHSQMHHVETAHPIPDMLPFVECHVFRVRVEASGNATAAYHGRFNFSDELFKSSKLSLDDHFDGHNGRIW